MKIKSRLLYSNPFKFMFIYNEVCLILIYLLQKFLATKTFQKQYLSCILNLPIFKQYLITNYIHLLFRYYKILFYIRIFNNSYYYKNIDIAFIRFSPQFLIWRDFCLIFYIILVLLIQYYRLKLDCLHFTLQRSLSHLKNNFYQIELL